MDTSWSKSLAWVRKSEGGNDDDPDDAGGRTSRGITQREWNAYCDIAGLKRSDVWLAPDPAIDDIYHRSYWLPYCSVLPPGVDYIFFDENVNAGLHEAALILQRALIKLGLDLGPTGADGHIGILTSAALSKADPIKLVNGMSDERVAIYKEIEAEHSNDRKFDKGWMARVEFARTNALTLVPQTGS